MDIPSCSTCYVFYDELKSLKVERRDSIKSNVEQYQGPFEKGVDRVSYSC